MVGCLVVAVVCLLVCLFVRELFDVCYSMFVVAGVVEASAIRAATAV